nr:PAS domain S-box protein [uncultured Noviherbaspirillum sp.]
MVTEEHSGSEGSYLGQDCVKLLDLGGRLVAMNRNAVCAMEIARIEDVRGRHWASLWPAECQPLVEAALSTARAGGTGQFSASCPTAKGQPRWWEVKVNGVPGADGGVGTLLAVCRDVTSQHDAADALQLSEERFRLLIAATSAIVWNASASGNFDGEQASWNAFTGQTVAEAQGAGWLDAVHPDDRSSTMARWMQSVSSSAVFEAEYRLKRRDGQYRHVSARAIPVLDRGGVVREWVGVHADVTDRSQAEAQHRRAAAEAAAAAEANAKYRIFFEQGAYLAGVMSLDGTMLEANRLSLDAGGYRPEDVIGRKFWDCRWWNRSPALQASMRSGALQAASGSLFRMETPYALADGSERVIDLVLAPVMDGHGKVLFIAQTGTDITERKQVEQRLRLLDEMNEATRNASDPRVIMEEVPRLLGEHLRASRCAYADVEPNNDQFTIRHDWNAPGAQSSVGTYSLDLFGPRAARDMREGRTLVIRDVDRELTPAEGGDMFSAIGVKAIICCPLVKEGKLVAMMALHQDAPRDWSAANVTLLEEVVERSWAHIERIRAMETLRVEDRRKSEFLAVLAHELRNPLAPIRNGLQVMRVASGDPETVARVRDVMERQLAHLVHLVDDLLDIARITRGKVDLQKQQVALRTVVASAVETSLPAIESRRHQLSLRLPEPALYLTVDPTRISQVIGNLLTNAAKYTPVGGHIDVSARQDGGDVVLSVGDDGIGIPAESLCAIFDMFTQVGDKLDRTQGGLGIGLSLARRLVELHGGTIAVESAGNGQGTTFHVRLPLAAGIPVESPVDAGARQDARSDGRRFRILVVDDNADAAETMSDYLEMSGYASQVVYNGCQALEAVRTFRPEVVFLDIGMPGMNGYEVASEIRKIPEMAGVTLVALTGWGAGSDRQKAQEAGFDHHLTKPASFNTVQALLSALA